MEDTLRDTIRTYFDQDVIFAECIQATWGKSGISVNPDFLYDLPLPEGKEWNWIDRMDYVGAKTGDGNCFLLIVTRRETAETDYHVAKGTWQLINYYERYQTKPHDKSSKHWNVIPMPRIPKQRDIFPVAVLL